MREYAITQLLVTNAAGHYAGIIHLHDLLREGLM
jgi:CBS domain-containing protein